VGDEELLERRPIAFVEHAHHAKDEKRKRSPRQPEPTASSPSPRRYCTFTLTSSIHSEVGSPENPSSCALK